MGFTVCGDGILRKTGHRLYCMEYYLRQAISFTVCGDGILRKTGHRLYCMWRWKKQNLTENKCWLATESFQKKRQQWLNRLGGVV